MLRSSRLPATLLVAVASVFAVSAEIPVSYYRTASGKKEGELKTALHKLLYNHTEVSSYNALPDYFRRTDVYPQNNGRYGEWWDMYGNIPLYVRNGFRGLNREHSFPKSWWGGSTTTPAYVDLNHLYPSEAAANMAKSNYPLGEVQTPKFDNGITQVGYAVLGQGGGASQVFEPDDEYKGDFARTYFYMVTCYQNLQWKYTYMVNNNDYPTLNPWSVSLLLKWHKEDPVSQKEIDRNEEVYRIQANRNPFIDYPELADYLWGSKKGQIWIPGSSQEPAGDPELVTPVQGMALEFGETAIGTTNTSSLFFQGQNLKGSLSIMIYRGDKDMFSADASSISASVVNSDNGYWLKVKYAPTELGTHESRLLISDGGLEESSRAVILRGECLPEPELHDFKALAATDVTSTSYTANWDVPANDVVDYYVVTRTVYANGAAASEDIEAETNELLVDGCEPGTRESYNVRSARLGFFSARSNEVFVDLESGGIMDVSVDNPLGWAYIEGGVRLVCGTTHTGCRVYDASGRLVRMIPEIGNNVEIMLPRGAFFIVTDQQRTPLKVLIRD